MKRTKPNHIQEEWGETEKSREKNMNSWLNNEQDLCKLLWIWETNREELGNWMDYYYIWEMEKLQILKLNEWIINEWLYLSIYLRIFFCQKESLWKK